MGSLKQDALPGAPEGLRAIQPRKGYLASLGELWSYRDLLRHLVTRELKVKYKRSIFGWLWSLANPLVAAVVFTLVFSFFLRIPPPTGVPSGLESYALFLLAGLLTWNYTSNVLSQGTSAIVTGGDLIRKVYFPRAVLVLSQAIALLVSFVVELVVLYVFILLMGGRPTTALVVVPLILLAQLVFVSGLGLVASGINVFFRDLQHLIGIVLMIWFYATPIVYPADRVPSHIEVGFATIPIGLMLKANPMFLYVEAYRSVFYHGRFPSGSLIGLMWIVAVAVGLIGYGIFRRLQERFAEEL